jgi:hypothetical protein
MAQEPQNYANHAYRPLAWNITVLVGLIAFLVLLVQSFQEPTSVSFALLALAGVVLSAVSLIRVFALRLQNRIIRLEMQVRLARLGRESALGRLTLPQIVALRFAADAELPALVDRTLSEDLKPDAIKRAFRDWQGDYYRT